MAESWLTCGGDQQWMSEAEYMYMNEDITIEPFEDEDLEEQDRVKRDNASKLIRKLALYGRRMKNSGVVVLDILCLDELVVLADSAAEEGTYNRKYIRSAFDVVHGKAHYLSLQKKRLVLMGFIRPYVDIKVLTFSE
ncbi:hypothetical protein Bcp1_197 [Bacillus phage Bcp1]|uniref:Uncharacterized protein n=1 Tax=Bacillus phage Bcp1 TaxID=584892 RepID=X2JN29_9CAUD|nr:hypothetical protein Bcp1_197 [Bacillus phage Bcp1]AHN66672.1 hypothetical protein Bcp1_197 [Bacillus phage Bcp1]